MALKQECSLDYFCSRDKFLAQASSGEVDFSREKLFSLRLKENIFFPSSFLFYLFFFFPSFIYFSCIKYFMV